MKAYGVSLALFFSTGLIAQDRAWEATVNCKNAFGFYNQCSGYNGTLNLDSLTASSPRISGRTTLLFDLSCSRVVGTAPKVTVEVGGTQANLAFTNTPSLQAIEVPAVPQGQLVLTFTPAAATQFAPDCRVDFLGSISVPDVFAIENLLTEQSVSLETLENNLAQVNDLKRLPAKWGNVAEVEAQTQVIRKSLEVNCLRNVLQVNRRFNKALASRTTDDNTVIELLMGKDFLTQASTVDRSVCSTAQITVNDRRIEGAVGVLIQELNELDTLGNGLTDAIPQSEACRESPESTSCLSLGNQVAASIESSLALFRGKKENLLRLVQAEKSRVNARITDLKNTAAKRNVSILQSLTQTWNQVVSDLNGQSGSLP